MLPLVNNAVRINFLMDRLQLCAPLIRAIENSGLLDKWGSSELVPYRFYLGQSHMRKGNLKAAEELLSYAFDNCPLRPARNVRLILIYLIPLKLMKASAHCFSLYTVCRLVVHRLEYHFEKKVNNTA